MPRLLLFAACRQVLLNGRDDTVSLVSLLERVSVQMDADGNVPTVADVTWEHLSIWEAEFGDTGQSFEQRLEVVLPDRRVAAEARHTFAMEQHQLRVVGSVAGFPSRTEGRHVVRLSIRNVLDPDTWLRVCEYPVTVQHLPAAESPASPPPSVPR